MHALRRRRRRIRARRPKPGGATPSTAASRPAAGSVVGAAGRLRVSESVDDAHARVRFSGGRAILLQAHDLLAADGA